MEHLYYIQNYIQYLYSYLYQLYTDISAQWIFCTEYLLIVSLSVFRLSAAPAAAAAHSVF